MDHTIGQQLDDYFTRRHVYEDSSDRDDVVNQLTTLVSHWVDTIAKRKKIGKENVQTGTHVRMFGGCSLGVVTKGADLDLVALTPKFVSRDDFFTNFPCTLKSNPKISRLRSVSQAYVPIIGLVYEDIKVDLCLCVLPLEVIPDDLDVFNDDVLDGVDEFSARSLSGIRETSTLIKLVPDFSVFSKTLKVIKHWAKCRCIHHYPLGFPGGIAWAIMVAKLHMMHPDDDVLNLITKFFRTYLEWKWPEPVLLQPLKPNCKQLQQWNREVCSADGRHLMPVISPAYPEHNVAFTISHSTLRVVQMELARGSEIMEKFQHSEESWETLFRPLKIEQEYKHFLVVTARAVSEQHIRDWGGLVEARIRILTDGLEKQAAVSLIQPGTESKSAVKKSGGGDVYTQSWVLGLELNMHRDSHLSLAPEVKQFMDTIQRLAVERDIYKPGMTADVQHVKRKHINDHFK